LPSDNVADLVGSVVGNIADLGSVVQDIAAISVIGAPLAAVVAFLVAWASLTALAARRARLCVGVALVVFVALWTAVALVLHGQEAHARWQPGACRA
jgi:hypothetical protein